MKSHGIAKLLPLIGTHGDEGYGGWYHASCPLAFWTHHNGHDNNPSFGIEVNDAGPSRVKCFSCGFGGSLEDLLMRMIYLTKKQPCPKAMHLALAMQLIADEEMDTSTVEYEEMDYDSLKAGQFAKVVFKEFPEMWLDSFMSGANHPYLKGRGITPAVAAALDTRFDFSQSRVCFPLRTFAGVLGGLQGRRVMPGEPRYKLYDYQGHFNLMLWGNENRVTLDQPLMLTEGWFDLAKIFPCYTNVLCSLTSEISEYKFDRIKDVDRIISYYDFGTGGDKARTKLEYYCKKHGILLDHIIPDEETGDAGNEQYSTICEAVTYFGLTLATGYALP